MKNNRGRRGDYKVGKGRPPDEYKFKPGQCGNPKGRPKGSKNVASKAKDALRRKVVVTINGVRRTMSVEAVAFHRLGEKAVGGDQKALNYLLTLSEDVEPASLEGGSDKISADQDRALIAGYLRRLRRGSSQ